jgi:ribonuclease HI
MPMKVGTSVNDAFKYIKERIWNNVLGWMQKFLSSGGKGILIKSVLQAIPTYSMSCFKLPRGLCEHLNSVIRCFWWGSSKGKRKPHWVPWSEMTKPKYGGGLGFRDMELFNIALLARQAWRLLTNPFSLSARILRAVYYQNDHFLSADLGSSPSKIWRAICEGRDALKLGLVKRIGSGEQTKIWSENWLPRDSRRLPVTSINESPPVWVSQLIDQSSRSWNLEQLNANFIQMDIDIIRSIPLGLANHDDFWAWHFERHGNFSVRSAYKLLTKTKNEREAWLDEKASSSGCNDQKNWTSLWRTKVPSKIRVFLWRLSHQSLPTGNVLHRRHMSDISSCSLCHATNDSWRHSLLQCNMAASTWALVDNDLVEHLLSNNCGNAKEWLFFLLETLSHEDFVRATVTLWAIWTARRKAIHEQIFQSPLSIFGFVNSFLADLKMVADVQNDKCSLPRRSCHSHAWVPPPTGMCKVSVDAAISKSSIAGAAGAICRDENGVYLGASARVFDGINDPVTLEAFACSEGLALAQDLGVRKIQVTTDCLVILQALEQGSLASYSSVLKEICDRQHQFIESKVVHERRNSNVEAHNFARSSVALQPGRHVWLGSSPDPFFVPKRTAV